MYSFGGTVFPSAFKHLAISWLLKALLLGFEGNLNQLREAELASGGGENTCLEWRRYSDPESRVHCPPFFGWPALSAFRRYISVAALESSDLPFSLLCTFVLSLFLGSW